MKNRCILLSTVCVCVWEGLAGTDLFLININGGTGGRLFGFKFSFVIFSWKGHLNASEEDIYSLFPICSGWKQTEMDQNGQLHLWYNVF